MTAKRNTKIDYSRLHLGHRAMMALLCAKARKLPEGKKAAETRAMFKTHGKQVSFVDDASLQELADSLECSGQGNQQKPHR